MTSFACLSLLPAQAGSIIKKRGASILPYRTLILHATSWPAVIDQTLFSENTLCLLTIRSSDWRIVKGAAKWHCMEKATNNYDWLRTFMWPVIGANQKTHPGPTRSHGESDARHWEDRIVFKHSAALWVCLANQNTHSHSWSWGCMENKLSYGEYNWLPSCVDN